MEIDQLSEVSERQICSITEGPLNRVKTYMVLMIEGTWKCSSLSPSDVDEFLKKFTGKPSNALWEINKRFGDNSKKGERVTNLKKDIR